jgi:hypothetical protein
MNATQDEVKAAIAKGRKELNSDGGDGGKSATGGGGGGGSGSGGGGGDGIKQVNDGEEERKRPAYEQISANTGQAEALQQFTELYKVTCVDFDQSPKNAVLDITRRMINKIADPENLVLCGKETGERMRDDEVFPLFEVLGHGYPHNPFHTIDLSFNNIKNSGAKAVAVYLTQTISLTSLNLEGNSISHLGCEKLALALHGQETLKVLNLNSNPIGDKGIVLLAESLEGNQVLTELNLGNTDVSTLGLIKIAKLLASNASITSLNLDRPIIHGNQEDTTIALARALGTNEALTTLSMQKHNLTDHGAKWFGEYLERNKTLASIDFSCNHLTATGVAALAGAMGLRELDCEIKLSSNLLRGTDHDEVPILRSTITSTSQPFHPKNPKSCHLTL